MWSCEFGAVLKQCFQRVAWWWFGVRIAWKAQVGSCRRGCGGEGSGGSAGDLRRGILDVEQLGRGRGLLLPVDPERERLDAHLGALDRRRRGGEFE